LVCPKVDVSQSKFNWDGDISQAEVRPGGAWKMTGYLQRPNAIERTSNNLLVGARVDINMIGKQYGLEDWNGQSYISTWRKKTATSRVAVACPYANDPSLES